MLTRQQMERLDALAAETGRSFPRTTAFAAFVAVLAVLLNRVGGARRLCIGIPVHNRRTRAGRDTLGLLMQVVPLTVRVDEDDTFLSLLERVELDALESWRYAQHTIPTSARQPLYDAVLNFHSPLDAALGGAPIQAVLLHSGHQLESLSIHVHDMPQAGVLTLDFDLHADVFLPERRELVVDQFLRVLDAVLEDPRQAVADIHLLSADEERRLLVGLNSERLPLPEHLTYPALFEAQAERTPSAVAAAHEGETSPTRRSTPGGTSWRESCGSAASAPRRASACSWSPRSTRPWPCWASSRPAVGMCPSTRAIRAIGLPSCCATRACASSSP